VKIFKISILTLLLLSLGCHGKRQTQPQNTLNQGDKNVGNLKKIPILNVGTFHFGYTPDANTTEFDENDKNNQKQAHDIAKSLATFKPTVILVEYPPEYNEKLVNAYIKYLENPKTNLENPSEIELLAFETGRISGVKRIYGIDHKMDYNYMIGSDVTNHIDSVWYNKFDQNPLSHYPDINVNMDSLSLLDKLKLKNHPRYLDFLIAINADMLTHIGSDQGFEGADEATKFYQRNLRMYSNLNRIELNENDRVFILMGAAHTAFFRDFISRSPKYEMVNTFEYLK
jgi:hypothetical protein